MKHTLIGFLCALILSAGANGATSAGDRELSDIAQRLRRGDRTAIAELLTRTSAPTCDLDGTNARIERLRAEIDALRMRRGARPAFPLVSARENIRPMNAAGDEGASTRVDGLREAIAWMRADDPERALRAVPNTGETALYVEARALERLGRTLESLEIYRRIAAEATSPVLRERAAGDVAHLEWRERVTKTNTKTAEAKRP